MDLLIAPFTVTKEQADTAPATGVPGWATDGDPTTNKPATQWPAYAFNALQEEILSVIQGGGLKPNRDDNTLLFKAVNRLIATATGGVLPPVRGGTGLDWVAPGNYLVGNGTATMTSRTPAQVLRDIGAIPLGGALRRVRLTAETDANTLIEDNVFYAWSNSVAMGANFPNIKGPGYLHSTIMASDYVTQDLVLIASALKPYCFNRAGNPVTGVWHPWKVTSSFSDTNVIPKWDAGDIYMDGVGWHRWNGARYVADYSLRRFPASALPATDVGPVLVAEFGEIWHWVSTPGYAGYRSPTCGQIAYFLTDREPAGWLKANGTEASRKVFAGLFSIIGTRHGAGDGVTNFRLPDLRGEFIRSLDDSRGIDPGRSLGSNQADAFQGHGHRFMRGSGSIGSGMYGAGFSSSAPDDTKVLEATGIGVNGAPRTANETRPRNIALLACIKI